MSTLFPSTVLSCPSKPQQPFSTWKTKPPDNNFSAFCKILHPPSLYTKATQSPLSFSTSTCEQSFLLNDWPDLLQISIGSTDFRLGLAIHAFLMKLGPEDDPFRGNNIINMYVKFNRLNEAQRVFDEMLIRNAITWTSLINGYLQLDDIESVFRVAQVMYQSGEGFNEYTCSVLLQACCLPRDRIRGEQIHVLIIKSGFEENVVIGTSLISMYSKVGCLENAERVFKNLAEIDIQCMNSMISEYGKAGEGKKAVFAFCSLQVSSLKPNSYTFTNVISACRGDIGVGEGMQLHGLAIKYDVADETSVENAVIAMYGKHGLVEETERAFHAMDERNLISWTALLSGYVKNGQGEKAIGMSVDMLDLGIPFDSSCLATMVDCCSEFLKLNLGHQIHGLVIKLGYLSDAFVGTALVDMYAKFGDLTSARRVFSSLMDQNAVTFNAILAGYMETADDCEERIMILFDKCRLAGMKPDSVTFAQLLSLSAKQVSMFKGMSLHAYVIKAGFEEEYIVGNAVITMYAKCGSIEDATRMFNCLTSRDSISWNSMISAHALHGQGEKALLLFEEMKKEGFMPDKITILAVLQACCYSGLFEDGFNIFNDMVKRYGIKPIIEHHACMVDLLARAGHLSEAVDFIRGNQFASSPMPWRTLVNVCKLRGDLKFGKLASRYLLDLAPADASSYILVSNLYASGGMLEEAAKVRTLMNDRRVIKEAGCSWIEIDDHIHCFTATG